MSALPPKTDIDRQPHRRPLSAKTGHRLLLRARRSAATGDVALVDVDLNNSI
jgi:hypothetical protein